MKVTKVTTGKWKDKEYRKEYGRKWREKQKNSKTTIARVESSMPGDQPMSKWAQRQAQKKASQVRPLKLCGCPECSVEFGIRKDGQYQDIKLDNCPVCGIRFYKAGGAE